MRIKWLEVVFKIHRKRNLIWKDAQIAEKFSSGKETAVWFAPMNAAKTPSAGLSIP
jgi:hypothetical protein